MKAKILFTALILLVQIACTTKSDKPTAHNTPERNAGTEPLPSGSKYAVEQLDNTKGLSNSSVNCIFQDSENLIWIGTWDGLNRYDGTGFKTFRPQPGKNSISNQVVLKIGEDAQGNIWLLTMHGINCYNKRSNTFTHFYFSSENKPPVSESQFNLAFDASKNVYCAVKDWGIGYFNGNKFELLATKELQLKTITKIDVADKGVLLALTDDNTLYSVTIKTYPNESKAALGTSKLLNNISTFCKAPNNQIGVVSTNGEAALYNLDGKNKVVVPGKAEGFVGQINEGIILSGKSGYRIIDTGGNEISKVWTKHLFNHKITTVIEGSENIFWAGSDGDGIIKIFPSQNSFNLVSRFQMPELDGGIIRAFIKDSADNFWVGTKGKGLFKLPVNFYKQPDKNIIYKHFNENNSVIDNSVYALCNGNNNLLFIGTDGEGITVYDPEKARLISWAEIKGTQQPDYFKSVYSIYQDNDGFIWLGTNGYGLIRLKIIKNNGTISITDFKMYTANNAGSSLSSNIVFSIIPRNENELWIGTRLGGLNLFDKVSGKFYTYKNVSGNPNSLSNNDILCMATDSDKRLWIGTSHGLNVLQEIQGEKAIFKSYTVEDGLPNNTIHGIVPVKGLNLWVSTNSGLSNFSINQSKFINYTKNEGLQNNEFADGAYYSDPVTGHIFMGGIKGFNYFLPEKVKESATVPHLLIDEISGQNQSVPYYQGLVISPHQQNYPSITLKHDQNFFDIHLRALTYTNSEKSQYAYQLNGFDEKWNAIGNRQTISFTNVPKGKYSLWLKWSNSEGIWSRPVHAADITIKAVWWQSDTALVIYILLAVIFILFVRSYNLKRQSLKQNILFRKKEEELHENKLTFFTNIAHEFLTPLTLIVGPAQKLAETASFEEKNSKYLQMIQRNASRLLFLTQQLLEFRKAENDYLENNVKNFDLVGLLEQIAELFDEWALDKKINYRVSIPSALHGWYDKDKVEKILFNLLSNAFKYTPENGTIDLKCTIEAREFKTLNITISNTGKGIPKEKLDSLFDRFFLSGTNGKTDTEMFRTGIGLAYIKRLVTVLRGEITVYSEADVLTTFTILLPCEKEAFSEKERDTETSVVVLSRHLKNILEARPETPVIVPDKISAIDAVQDTRKRLLIAEDEKEIQDYLKDLLGKEYYIMQAYNGAEALEIINKETPDLIVSDVMMPEMDGIELCRMVKTNLATCHIPFIMLTAKSSVMHRIEGIESGANSYIPKPFYPDHLTVRIKKLLEEKELIIKHFSQDTLVDSLPSIPINNDEKAFIRSIIELVRKNIDDENLDSTYIEKALGLSTSQLYRKTKETFGLPPGDLIRTLRLKYAAELLRKNVLTVSEICYKSGFNNRSYFYREFKKVYNTTPKNYQLQYKQHGAV